MLWLKALHLMAVICWFAGIFYLPRIMVYYAGSKHPETRSQLATMAAKLYRFVTPIAVVAVGLGLAMVSINPEYYLSATWLWLKLALVVALIAYHAYCGHLVRALATDKDDHTHVYFRVFNEIPVIFLVLIVLLAVLKPF